MLALVVTLVVWWLVLTLVPVLVVANGKTSY
jgi:hypothetical protein